MSSTTFACAACCGPMADSLARLGSVRCHDCLETQAPVREACVTGLREARPLPRELARRSGDGLEVTLLWFEDSGHVEVRVLDSRSGDRFQIRVDPTDALDAFHHPFAYATPSRAATEELVFAQAA
jgi:hypothetical protein